MSHCIERNYRGKNPLATLLFLFSKYRWKLIFASFFFVLKNLPVWITPLLLADIINIVTDPSHNGLNRIWVDGVIFFFLLLQNVPTHVMFAKLLSESARNMEADLRFTLTRKIQRLSMGYLQEKRTGALQTKLLRDVETVQGLSSQMITLFLSSAAGIIFAVSVTMKKQPLLLAFYIVAVPITIVIVRTFRKKMKVRNMEYREQMEMISSSILEMLQILPVTRAHGLEKTEIDIMKEKLETVKGRGMKLDLINGFFGSFTWFVSQSMQLLCLLTCGYLAWKGTIRPGDLVLYTSFFGIIVGSINHIIEGIPALSRGFESVRSIGEVLESPDVEQNEGKLPVKNVRGSFDFNEVSFTYPHTKRKALDNLSLSIKENETIAVVGESGSGKTTLMSMLIGYRRPSSGTMLIDGKDVNTLDLRQYRQFLSVVPQQTVLFSGSIRDNITYGLKSVNEKELRKVLEMARVDNFLGDLSHGLDTHIGEQGGRLSGGQRQRIAIARALIRNPRVIIFDEATSALDVVSEKLVQEAINQMIRGRTTFIVAHRLSTVRNADRVVVMSNGKIIEEGRYETLLRSGGEFTKLKTLQS